VSTVRGDVVLEVLAADSAGAWGPRPWWLVVDEVRTGRSTPGPRLLFEAVSSAVAKLADARMILLTSAGDPARWSAKVLAHAVESPLWR
jgi:hypothetical protein